MRRYEEDNLYNLIYIKINNIKKPSDGPFSFLKNDVCDKIGEEDFILFSTFASIVEREFHSLSHLRFLQKLGNRGSVKEDKSVYAKIFLYCQVSERRTKIRKH